MDKRVGFLICGTQKGGTTALHQYLRGHPSLYLPKQKELHFFDDESKHWLADGRLDRPNSYQDYERRFSDAPEGKLLGEATPIYMYWQPCPQRIWQYNCDIKLIAVLRNPISRAYAHWSMETGRKNEVLPFFNAIQQEEERCRRGNPWQHRIYSYVDRGRYSEQLRRLWQLFGRSQVHVLKHEHLLENPAEALNSIWQFLKVEPIAFQGPIRAHEGSYSEPIPSPARQWLEKEFHPEIMQLEHLLGWNCSDWLKQ